MEYPKLGIYRHYKNKKLYRVHAIGYVQENLDRVVIYEALYKTDDIGDHPWMTRPLEEFMAQVETEEGSVPRFSWVKDA